MATTIGSYGYGYYGELSYGGIVSELASNALPVLVQVYNSSGTKKGVYQTGLKLIGTEFELTQSGCGYFELQFDCYVDITYTDQITIQLFGSSDNFFKGEIRNLPVAGSTERNFVYSGYGFIEYFTRVNTGLRTYTNKTPTEIVVDLVDNVLVPESPATKDLSLIDTFSNTITSVQFKYIDIGNAFRQCGQLAGGDIQTGVNEEGNFFFQAKSDSVTTTYVVGRQIPTYVPEEDTGDIINSYKVIDRNGSFITTVSDATSVATYGKREKLLTAPQLTATADIVSWAGGVLADTKDLKTRAQVLSRIEGFNPTFVHGRGSIRILSDIRVDQSGAIAGAYGDGGYGSMEYGGVGYTGETEIDVLRVQNVVYRIRDNESVREIELGGDAISLNEEIRKINQNVQNLRTNLGR